MSITEILNSVEGLETNKFEQLYQELFALRAKRNNTPRLDELESQLLSQINTPFDTKKWERLTFLDWKLEFSALSPKEESDLLKLAEAYENHSVERVKNLFRGYNKLILGFNTFLPEGEGNLYHGKID